MDTPSVQLEFPFTFGDRFRAGVAVTTSCWLCMIWVLAFPLLGIALPIVAYLNLGRVPTIDWLLCALLLAFVPAVMLWSTWRGHRTFADTPLHLYTIDAQGVRSSSAHMELRQDWSMIRTVVRRRGFLMLYFRRQCAHCIPLRHLDGGQIARIAELARAGKVARVAV